jgi:cytochrome c-type biogenesis protein CcmE
MHRKYKFVIGIAIIVLAVASLVYTAVDQTKMYMVTVDEYLGSGNAYAGTTVRIAGRVRQDSMKWTSETRELDFTLDDIMGGGSLAIHYEGLLPDMFAEGRDVIVEGPHASGEVFEASAVLTSCPSKYSPESDESAQP